MNGTRVIGWTVGILGLVVSSPLNLVVVGVMPNAWFLGLLFLLDGVGVWVSALFRPIAGMAVLLACVVNLPLLWSVGVPEAGEWASLFAIPKYTIFLAAGWWSWWWKRRTQGTCFRWLGAVAPSLCCVYILLRWLVTG